MMPTHLFLDLEGTVVDSLVQKPFYDILPRGIERSREVIKEYVPKTLNIFSFALWTAHDVRNFHVLGKDRLEHFLGMKFSLIPNCQEITSLVAEHLHLNADRCDFSDLQDFLGKGVSFVYFVKQLVKKHPSFVGNQFILLDDLVDLSVTTLADRTVIKTIPV